MEPNTGNTENELHSWTERETCSLQALLSCSSEPFSALHEGSVTNVPAEISCGWRPVPPRASYSCSKACRKRRSGYNLQTSPTPAHNRDHSTQWPYMSGQLDHAYSYSYTGGLSGRAQLQADQSRVQLPSQPPAACHRQVINLDPVISPYRTAAQVERARQELSAILTMQLKPELLVEQLIIENRLRTMSLSVFQPLEGIRFDSRSKLQQNKSKSSSALIPHPQQHRKRKRRRLASKGPLEWCTLAQLREEHIHDRGEEDEREGGAGVVMSFNGRLGEADTKGGMHMATVKRTAWPIQQPGVSNRSGAKALPVVSPQLDVSTSGEKESQTKLQRPGRTWKPHS